MPTMRVLAFWFFTGATAKAHNQHIEDSISNSQLPRLWGVPIAILRGSTTRADPHIAPEAVAAAEGECSVGIDLPGDRLAMLREVALFPPATADLRDELVGGHLGGGGSGRSPPRWVCLGCGSGARAATRRRHQRDDLLCRQFGLQDRAMCGSPPRRRYHWSLGDPEAAPTLLRVAPGQVGLPGKLGHPVDALHVRIRTPAESCLAFSPSAHACRSCDTASDQSGQA